MRSEPRLIGGALSALTVEWRARATDLRNWGAGSNADTLERAANELEKALLAGDERRLTLEDAASESGYSVDHLRRLARTGKLVHSKQGRRYFFRAGDLPRRTPMIDAPDIGRYDADADARKVAGMRAHGAN